MSRSFSVLLCATLLVCATAMILIGTSNTSLVYAQSPATSPAVVGDIARGKYIADMGCVGCHGDRKLASTQGVPLAGGRQFVAGPNGTIYAPNLTVLQNWTTDDFLKVFHEGVDPKTDKPLAPIMPLDLYHDMSDYDVASVGAYLKSLKPVRNMIPANKLGPAAASWKAMTPVSVPAVTVDDSAAYGKYLAYSVYTCVDCHTASGPDGFIKGKEFAGSPQNFGTDAAPEYTPAILGTVLTDEGYTRDSFALTIR